MKAIHLRTEYLAEPTCLGNDRPRFFWTCEGGVTQSAYQIEAKRKGEVIWNTGKVISSRMTHILYEGSPLYSRDEITWSVTLWDEKNRKGKTSEGHFTMGLLSASDWNAKWIRGVVRKGSERRLPADYFRKNVTFPKGLSAEDIVSASLYASARGVYTVTVNGQRLKDHILAPGSTDYRKRIQYQKWDVKEALLNRNLSTDAHAYTKESYTKSGAKTETLTVPEDEAAGKKKNIAEIVLTLGDGWWRGSTAAYGVTNVYGKETSVLAQLEILFADGTKQVVGTDGSWDWSNDGPIRFDDLKDGEIYDAAMQPSFSGKAVEMNTKTAMGPAPEKPEKDTVYLVSSDNVPVKEQEHFSAAVLRAEDGTTVYDFGQNIAGYLKIRAKGQKGEKLFLRCGEILDEAGRVDLSGIQETTPIHGWTEASLMVKLTLQKVFGETDLTPRQEVTLFLSGNNDVYETSFAVFGFRYAELIGNPDAIAEIRAVAVYSDLAETGTFSCSNGDVNQLVQNVRWSMKGNYLDVPTDCPTRERLGWTGDAQVFFKTGAYFMDTAAFFRKWIADMQDAQYRNGLLPSVLPYAGAEMMYKMTGASVGWADAVYLVPYRYYLMYGDKAILESTWPMIKKYSDYLMGHLGMQDKKEARKNPYNAYTYEKGIHLGEWLEPDAFSGGPYNPKEKHPEECTAYLFYAMTTIGEIAKLLGENDYAQTLAPYAEGAKKAYHYLIVEQGKLDTDRPAKLVRPLALGLLEDTDYTQKRLAEAVRNFDYCVGTGFLSTPFLLPVLSEAGEDEIAYKVLLNEKQPGWLSEIKAGATTIWEDWEGRVSRNHYSPGAVCEWLFSYAAGIRPDGERRFVIEPHPGPQLSFAKAEWQSVYGTVRSGWGRREDGTLRISVEIPANTTAIVRLPDGRTEEVSAGKREWSKV